MCCSLTAPLFYTHKHSSRLSIERSSMRKQQKLTVMHGRRLCAVSRCAAASNTDAKAQQGGRWDDQCNQPKTHQQPPLTIHCAPHGGMPCGHHSTHKTLCLDEYICAPQTDEVQTSKRPTAFNTPQLAACMKNPGATSCDGIGLIELYLHTPAILAVPTYYLSTRVLCASCWKHSRNSPSCWAAGAGNKCTRTRPLPIGAYTAHTCMHHTPRASKPAA